MQATVTPVPDPFLQGRSAAITQVAVFEAVNAIVGDYEPYLGSVTAPPGASPEAAAIAAAHRALASLHPDQAGSLDARRIASLAEVPDGPAKDAGIAVGEAAALAVLAARANDGSDTDTPYTPGTEPGRYRPTPPDFTPAFRPGLGQVEDIRDRERGAVPRRPSAGAAKRALHARLQGGQAGRRRRQHRPPARPRRCRTLLCSQRHVQIYFPAARQASVAQGKTLAENARIFALLGMAIFDVGVACFESKYFYDYWRPVTAIQPRRQRRQPQDRCGRRLDERSSRRRRSRAIRRGMPRSAARRSACSSACSVPMGTGSRSRAP